ncbi:SBBP repeat-containing protein [Thermodesulfobacteriota bacterium]
MNRASFVALSFIAIFLVHLTHAYPVSAGPEWTAFYNGPGNDSDQSYDLTIDGSGNVYVTGRSKGDGTGSDYLKYVEAPREWPLRPGQLWALYTEALFSE